MTSNTDLEGIAMLDAIATAIEAYNRPNNRIINMCVGYGMYTRDILALLRLDVQYFSEPTNRFIGDTQSKFRFMYTLIAIRLGYTIPTKDIFEWFFEQANIPKENIP
tara:strand:- start:2354 stop:2674 length:321 start_codon:yes stop_codon:yes gene_type:complete